MRELACQYLVLLQGHDSYLHGEKSFSGFADRVVFLWMSLHASDRQPACTEQNCALIIS